MSPRIPLSLFLLLSLLSLTVNGRPHPCDTLIISTFTFSLRSHPIPNPNVNLLPLRPHPDVISFFTTTTTTTNDLPPDLLPHHHLRHRFFLSRHHPRLPKQPQQNNEEFLGFSSLKDRTKDILSVVVSLLFGAACGALTATTMYLIWSLFNPRSYRSVEEFSSSDDDDDHDDHDDPNSDVFNPKKNGYVAIPPPPVVEADLNVAPAKESA